MKTSIKVQLASFKLWMVVISLVSFGFTLQAQTQKGNFTVGLHNFSPSGMNVDGVPVNLFGKSSSLGLSWTRSHSETDGVDQGDGKSEYALGLNLCGHYFLTNHLAVGVVGNYFSGFSAYTKESDVNGRYSARMILVGPELKYFLGNGQNKFWLKGSVAKGGMNIWWDGQKQKPLLLSQVSAGAGVSFFLSRKISLDVGAEYNVFTMTKNQQKGISSNVALDLGFSLFF